MRGILLISHSYKERIWHLSRGLADSKAQSFYQSQMLGNRKMLELKSGVPQRGKKERRKCRMPIRRHEQTKEEMRDTGRGYTSIYLFWKFPSFLKTQFIKPSDKRNNFRIIKYLPCKGLNRFKISDRISLFILCVENKVMIPHIWILSNYKDLYMEVSQVVSNYWGRGSIWRPIPGVFCLGKLLKISVYVCETFLCGTSAYLCLSGITGVGICFLPRPIGYLWHHLLHTVHLI